MDRLDGIGMYARDDDPVSLRDRCRALLDNHWLPSGYTMPNRRTYPWQWLWDSCFHSIVWGTLGDERALIELSKLFAHQTSGGFVPHMGYHHDPGAAVGFWGRTGSSTITQPPMYGHAVAELIGLGMVPPDHVMDAAARGLQFLFERRRRSAGGLIELCHPWEAGCDDSARWDSALSGAWNRDRWRACKHALIRSVQTDAEGAAVHNDSFAVGSIGFCALVAFNAIEFDRAVGASDLGTHAVELIEAIEARWDGELRTWVDDGPLTAVGSGRARTSDALLPLLAVDRPDIVDVVSADLIAPDAFGAPFGPSGVHRDEPTRDPDTYWRGPAWPQISYLLWLALRRRGHEAANELGASLRGGVVTSGFAEYWNPDTGRGAGATPQSWSTLALLVDEADRSAFHRLDSVAR